MSRTRRVIRVARLCLAVGVTAACARVDVATNKPIVIQLNIEHEIRLKIDENVEGLIEQEEQRTSVSSRGLDDGFPLTPDDARSVQAAKRARAAGERADGYLGVVPGSDSRVLRSLAERVNDGRRTSYSKMATSYNASLKAVEVLAGRRRIDRARPGERVMPADGHWTSKPEPAGSRGTSEPRSDAQGVGGRSRLSSASRTTTAGR